MQMSGCSTEGLSQDATLEDILHIDGTASVLIQFLNLEDKRNLRLVCHAGKDAVDKTVTAVIMPGVLNDYDNKTKCGIDYARILSNSNWKDIKNLEYSLRQLVRMANYRTYDEPEGLTHIAEAGLSRLESLTLDEFNHQNLKSAKDVKSAKKLVKAGWKLKKLTLTGQGIPSEWFGPLVRDANWPLEELSIRDCSDSIAYLIAKSDWKLKILFLRYLWDFFSSEGVETLMQAPWVSTLERLTLNFKEDVQKKGRRAIAQASHRAVNLEQLAIYTCEDGHGNTDALILAEGSFPNLKRLTFQYVPLYICGLAAILRKCPKLEAFESSSMYEYRWNSDGRPAPDPEDAKLVAEQYNKGVLKITNCSKRFKEVLAAYL